VGTALEVQLRRQRCVGLVIAGFFTNMCVETTARMAGNMGFAAYVVGDACAATNRIGPDRRDYEPDLVHALSLANLHGEFATVIKTADALELLERDASHLKRCQGNE
jgi:nicotinamidase-related amidase